MRKAATLSLSPEQHRQQRYDELVAWLAAQPLVAAPSPTVHGASTKGDYSGAELSAPAVRPGADAALSLPSRIGNRLYHRRHHNRCITDLTGQPVVLPQGA
ncbi:MAG: hypothetical protein ACYC4S_00505 [Rhodoferax sp.]